MDHHVKAVALWFESAGNHHLTLQVPSALCLEFFQPAAPLFCIFVSTTPLFFDDKLKVVKHLAENEPQSPQELVETKTELKKILNIGFNSPGAHKQDSKSLLALFRLLDVWTGNCLLTFKWIICNYCVLAIALFCCPHLAKKPAESLMHDTIWFFFCRKKLLKGPSVMMQN